MRSMSDCILAEQALKQGLSQEDGAGGGFGEAVVEVE